MKYYQHKNGKITGHQGKNPPKNLKETTKEAFDTYVESMRKKHAPPTAPSSITANQLVKTILDAKNFSDLKKALS